MNWPRRPPEIFYIIINNYSPDGGGVRTVNFIKCSTWNRNRQYCYPPHPLFGDWEAVCWPRKAFQEVRTMIALFCWHAYEQEKEIFPILHTRRCRLCGERQIRTGNRWMAPASSFLRLACRVKRLQGTLKIIQPPPIDRRAKFFPGLGSILSNSIQ